MTLNKLYQRLLDEADLPNVEGTNAYVLSVARWYGRGYSAKDEPVVYRVYSTAHGNSVEAVNAEKLIEMCRARWGMGPESPDKTTPDTDFGGSQ